MTIPFWKTEALGNDFVLVHADNVVRIVLPDLAVKACNRHTGVGSDGLLVLGKDLVLRMFNPDGTEDFCGNGLRCAAWHARAMGWVGDEFVIKHLGVQVPARIDRDDVVHVTLGKPSFAPADVPLNLDLHSEELWMEPLEGHMASAVNTGSTHLVLLVDQLPRDDHFFDLSPRLEVDPLFPTHTSVMWVERLSPQVAKLRIWERSAGETLACGSGNVAVATVLARLDGRGGEFTLQNPGGVATVKVPDDLTAPVLSSKVHPVYQGRLAL